MKKISLSKLIYQIWLDHMMSQRNKKNKTKQARTKNGAFIKSGIQNHYAVWALPYFKRDH